VEEIKANVVGSITEVQGPVVTIACERLPPLRQALSSQLNGSTYFFEVHQHLDQRHLRAICLNHTGGLHRGLPVIDTGAPLQVPVSPEHLGRMVNLFGDPLDGGHGPTTGERESQILFLPPQTAYMNYPRYT